MLPMVGYWLVTKAALPSKRKLSRQGLLQLKTAQTQKAALVVLDDKAGKAQPRMIVVFFVSWLASM